jgi:hypothetical protein
VIENLNLLNLYPKRPAQNNSNFSFSIILYTFIEITYWLFNQQRSKTQYNTSSTEEYETPFEYDETEEDNFVIIEHHIDDKTKQDLVDFEDTILEEEPVEYDRATTEVTS